MNEPKLIKIDRNGSKHFEGRVKCDRCGGDGIYKWGAVINGRPQYAGVCFKCGGCGWVIDKWIERTSEYQAKLDAKRQAKNAERQAKLEAEYARLEAERKAEQEKREAERKAEEERIRQERAVSQFVGTVGEKIQTSVEYVCSPYFERKCFGGWDTEICYIHTFKDEHGNKIVWKTASGLELDEGAKVTIKATVKEHSEYKNEKQTAVLRLKVVA